MVGKTLGKYRIVEKIGRGGMGVVYLGLDETLDRQVAIKAISPELVEDDLVRRFRAEAVTLAKVNHRNIATVYELFRDDDRLLMVMELVRGQTFEQLIEHTGPMPFDRAASLTGQILDALGHAHRAGIVHRDLKPANLMLTEAGIVKVMDFGIAKVASAARNLTILTRANLVSINEAADRNGVTCWPSMCTSAPSWRIGPRAASSISMTRLFSTIASNLRKSSGERKGSAPTSNSVKRSSHWLRVRSSIRALISSASASTSAIVSRPSGAF